MKKFNYYFLTLSLALCCSATVQAQTIIEEDLIVKASECIGTDCINTESFGFSTLRLKENNLRIEFDDTSTGTFPGNDWILGANSIDNGGANMFFIRDKTAEKDIATFSAGAPSNSFYMNSTGNIGLKTSSPFVELHMVDGDTPAIRLEQDGSVGWTPYTWDLAGNETNFFIRDVLTGNLPFKIKPGAIDNALYIASTGNVSIGSDAPTEKLEVNGNTSITGNAYIAGQTGVGTITPDANASLDLAAVDKGLILNRLTTAQRTTLSAGAVAGMVVYDTDLNTTFFWNGTEWVNSDSMDEQDLTSATLSGTTLTVAIENGASVNVDLSPLLADLQAVNAAQQAQIDALLARVTIIEECACGGTLSLVEPSAQNSYIRLDQNVPNPFDSETNISYFIPLKYQSARIEVVSSLGQLVFNLPLDKFGEEGTVNLKNSYLQSAIYFYTLYVDGKKIETKRLIKN